MPFSKESLQKSPYNKCIVCDHLGVNCDGPNFLCMDVDRWCEWCRLRRDCLGVTNEWIAENALVSEVTVKRIMTGNIDDLKVSTMQPVTRVLVNGTWGQYPCAIQEPKVVYQDNPALVQELAELHEERKRLNTAAERREAEHATAMRAAVEKAEKDAQKDADYLKRIIRVLAIVCAILLLVIIAALIVDATNPELGYFWRAVASHWAGNESTADVINYMKG